MTINSSVGYIVRYDLNNINNVVQNSLVSYSKEIIISILRDEFGKDSYYHYVADEFGFPKTPANHNLPIGAGYDDETTTRIFIGEAFRHDIVFYPSIIVKTDSFKHVSVSINRNRETVLHDAIKVFDGYNETVEIIPKAFVFQGAWDETITINISARDILSRDDLVSFCSLLFVDIKHDELLKAGLLIKHISISAPSETKDRNQEIIYKQNISIIIRSEWRREIPITNLVDFFNICVDFGRFDSSNNFVQAPNLTINTSLDEIALSEENSSLAPFENQNLFGFSRASANVIGNIIGV